LQKPPLQDQNKLLLRKEVLLEQLRTRIVDFRNKVIETNEMTLRNRAANNQRIAETLRITNDKVIMRHQLVRNRINKEAIRREVNVRVNRGLESLEEFISVLRISNMTDKAIKEAIEDPAISGSPGEKIKRASVSKFVKSIQRQLVEQSDFINIAAHELRTPIMPILVNAEILESDLGEKKEEIRIIVRNAYRLQHLAQNILDVARIDAGSLPLRKAVFNLNQLVSEIVEDHESRLGEGVRLSFHQTETVLVNADRERIAQVLSNILANAIRLTETGMIETSVAIQDNFAVVSVSDSGPGIDPQLFPVLFSRFGKKSYSGSGMGLGLYISRSIVEAHRGTIAAGNNPEPKKGATFKFTIPLESRAPLKSDPTLNVV
jgi:signal transduction histidine kinase